MKLHKNLLLIGVSTLLLSACSNDGEGTNDTAEAEEVEKNTDDKDVENVNTTETNSEELNGASRSFYEEDIEEETLFSFGLNEEAVFVDEAGEDSYGLKFTNITNTLTESSDHHTDGKPENTIEVTYEYTNYNFNEPIDVRSQFMVAYGGDSIAVEDVGLRDGQSEVSKGRTGRSTIWFVMNEPIENMDKIEIEYANDFVLGFEDYVVFELPIEK